MELTSAVALPFAILLVVSGFEKLRSPGGARAALELVGAPDRSSLTIGFPLAEIAVGVSYLLVGGRATGVLLLLTYATFVVVVSRQLLQGSRASCGCFGERSGELGGWHLAVDVAALGAAAGATVVGGGSPAASLMGMGWYGPAVAVAVLTITGLLRATLVDLPPLLTLARGSEVRT